MKKSYAKPEIIFEDFSLSINIAAGCEAKSNQAENVCGYATRSGVVFTSAISGCVFNEINSPDLFNSDGTYPLGNNTICYHVPSDDYNLFAS